MDLDDHEGAIERELPPLCRGCDEPTSEPTMHMGWPWCRACYEELPEVAAAAAEALDADIAEDELSDGTPIYRSRLTCYERLQGLADSGCDIWAEYRGER